MVFHSSSPPSLISYDNITNVFRQGRAIGSQGREHMQMGDDRVQATLESNLQSLTDGALANCPCCWRLDALQRATLADAKAPTALATGAKVLQRASRWTKCRLWRRFA